MLFEYVKCKKCNHINPPYKNICTECKSYLRERVVNIDLWNTILLIIEEPAKAFRQIIFSEHKNFIIFLTFFISLKNLIIARFISVPELGANGASVSLIFSLILMILITTVLTSSFSFIQNILYSRKNITLRFQDFYAVYVYSFIPYLFGLIFIFPVELIVLGGDIFSNNPYSFQIKPLISYILIGVELITIIWSFFLIFKSILVVSEKKNFSILLTVSFSLVWILTLYISSKIIFTL
jgi:RNA polymerase subunit RPABC4/transcription elongation factor Spt4